RHVGNGLLALSYHVGASRGIARQSPLGIEPHCAMQENHVPHSDGVTVWTIHWVELVRRDDLFCHGQLSSVRRWRSGPLAPGLAQVPAQSARQPPAPLWHGRSVSSSPWREMRRSAQNQSLSART